MAIPSSSALEKRWTEYFKALDANGNGFLEPEDAALVVKDLAKRLLLTEAQQTALGEVQTKIYKVLIDSADKNKDGKVSLEEFLALINKDFKGKKYEELPAWFRENLEGGAKFLDKNGDGKLSLDEWKSAYPNSNAAEYEAAFKRVSQGKDYLDLETYHKAIGQWASSTEAVPDLEIIFPFFKKQ